MNMPGVSTFDINVDGIFALDPTLVTSLLVAATTLAVAGIVLFVLERWSRMDVSSMWLTYRGWLYIFPLVLICFLGGRVMTILGVALVGAASLREYVRATRLNVDRRLTYGIYAALAAVVGVTLLTDPQGGNDFWYRIFMVLPVYVIVGLAALQIAGEDREQRFTRLCLSILGFVLFAWMFGHLGFLANAQHFYGYVFFLIFSIEICDVAAFAFGKAFGRHKLCPHISPNKTWEGAIGAFLVAMTLPWVLGFALPHFDTTTRLLAGLIVGIGGPLGDLTVSMLKREAGIKDLGTAIPGHGGVLDRVDSLVLATPLFFHMVQYFYGIH